MSVFTVERIIEIRSTAVGAASATGDQIISMLGDILSDDMNRFDFLTARYTEVRRSLDAIGDKELASILAVGMQRVIESVYVNLQAKGLAT